MKYGAILLACSLFPLSSPCAAHDRSSPSARVDTEPGARIRGVGAGRGLSPEGFAQWRKDNAALAGIAQSAVDRPGQSIRDFAAADADGDRSISAIELADWIAMRTPAPAEARHHALPPCAQD